MPNPKDKASKESGSQPSEELAPISDELPELKGGIYAREEYQRILPELKKLGHVTELGRQSLINYVEAFYEVRGVAHSTITELKKAQEEQRDFLSPLSSLGSEGLVELAGQNGINTEGLQTEQLIEKLKVVPTIHEELEAMVTTGDQFGGTWGGAFSKITDAAKKFGETGKLEIGSMIDLAGDLLQSLTGSGGSGGLLGSIGGLFGGSSGGGGLSGVLGSLGGIFGGLPSFDGGGYTGSASRSGGLDGKGGFLAMLHPQERVLDEAKMNSVALKAKKSSKAGVSVSNHFTIAPGVTREELNTVMEEAERQRQRDEQRRYLDGDPSTALLSY